MQRIMTSDRDLCSYSNRTHAHTSISSR